MDSFLTGRIRMRAGHRCGGILAGLAR